MLTYNNQVHKCNFGIALVDYHHDGPGFLDLEFGMIIEDIEFQTKGDQGRCSGRVRSRREQFHKEHVTFITDERLIDTLMKSRKSSQALYDSAEAFKDCHSEDEKPWFIDRLFMKSTDKAAQYAVWPWPRNYRYGLYVDRFGQLEDDALHVACINRDYLIVEFLLTYMGVDAYKRRLPFQGYQFIPPQHLDWHEVHGTPLTATVNAYHAIRYQSRFSGRRAHAREATNWAPIFSLLFRQDTEARMSIWQTFQDDTFLLGDPDEVQHIRANGQSLLESAIYYNDHHSFKRFVEAAYKQHLKIDSLPCPVLFNFEKCAGFSIKQCRLLSTDETFPILRVLQMNSAKLRGGDTSLEGDLQHKVPEIIWQNIQELKINEPLMKELLDLVMSQCNLDTEQTGWTAGTNLAALLKCKPPPNLQSWAENNGFTTVYHYVVLKNSSSALQALLDQGFIADINMSDELGKTPLDIAIELGYIDIAQTLRNNGGRPRMHTPARSEHGSALRNSSNMMKPHTTEGRPWDKFFRGQLSPPVPNDRNSWDKQSQVSSVQSVPTPYAKPFLSQAGDYTRKLFSSLNPQARPFNTSRSDSKANLDSVAVANATLDRSNSPMSVQEALTEIGSGTMTKKLEEVQKLRHREPSLTTKTEQWLDSIGGVPRKYQEQTVDAEQWPTIVESLSSGVSTKQSIPSTAMINRPSLPKTPSFTAGSIGLSEQHAPRNDIVIKPWSGPIHENAIPPQTERIPSQTSPRRSTHANSLQGDNRARRSHSPLRRTKASSPYGSKRAYTGAAPRTLSVKSREPSAPDHIINHEQRNLPGVEMTARHKSPKRKNVKKSASQQKGTSEPASHTSTAQLEGSRYSILSDQSDDCDG